VLAVWLSAWPGAPAGARIAPETGGPMETNRGAVAAAAGEARPLTNVTMQEAVQALRDRGIPLCFEQVPLVPEQATRRADGSIDWGQTRFDVVLPAGSVAAVLDALVAADPEYRWEQAGTRPTYAVYPADGGVLTWQVPARDLQGVDWLDAIRDSGIDQHGVSLFPRGLERQPKVALDGFAPAATDARHWLSLVVDYVGQGRYWNLAGVAPGRSLVIGQVAPPEATASPSPAASSSPAPSGLARFLPWRRRSAG
jgi:hypothetical protein